MTIPQCFLSVTIFLGAVSDRTVVERRRKLLGFGDADRGREDDIIHVDRGVVFLGGPPGLAPRRAGHSAKPFRGTEIHRTILLLLITAALAATLAPAKSQSMVSSAEPAATSGITNPDRFDLNYIRPTERTKVSNYAFDAFGPYPIAAAGVTAGINQWTNSPPEWGQGAESFGKRFGSDFAIAAMGTTTRYGLAEAFREDTLYYRCECSSPFPRLRHAVSSTLTGRRGEDGHRAFSISLWSNRSHSVSSFPAVFMTLLSTHSCRR